MQSEFVCKPVNNEGCTRPDGGTSWHGEPVRRFDVIQDDAYPCAVISQALPHNYQLNIWYAHKNNMTMNGYYHISDRDCEYRCKFHWDDGYVGDDKTGAAKLYLYKSRVPLPGSRRCGYNDVIHPVTLNVTDLYGNKGRVKIVFDQEIHCHYPRLRPA